MISSSLIPSRIILVLKIDVFVGEFMDFHQRILEIFYCDLSSFLHETLYNIFPYFVLLFLLLLVVCVSFFVFSFFAVLFQTLNFKFLRSFVIWLYRRNLCSKPLSDCVFEEIHKEAVRLYGSKK